jgi:hypothetical protein
VGNSAARARAEAIEGFAAVLSQLRDSVGRPSFRSMAGRSGAISHTTLHEAVQGNRLPSWATTAEFVRACGANPQDYRERWEHANQALGSAGVACSIAAPSSRAASRVGAVPAGVRINHPPDRLTGPQDAPPEESPGVRTRGEDGGQMPSQAGPSAGAETASLAAAGSRRRGRGRYAALGVATAGLLATGAGVAAWKTGHDQAPPVPSPQYVAADCPVHQTNPPAQPPAQEGNSVAFVADITLPDCVHVRRGQTVAKVWRLKNTGTVPWVGYTLHRIDLPQTRDHCQTITDVPIANTPPGHLVDAKVQVAAPTRPGFCFVRFKLVDAQGRVAFPGSRPVNFQVVVD